MGSLALNRQMKEGVKPRLNAGKEGFSLISDF
jgi:hypothetical protein